jgi:lipopolysaccharide transport system permease protein
MSQDTNESKESWDMIIKPKTGWFDIDLKEIWRYRDLIGMFVKRDFVTFYKQTILGPLWYIIQPLFTTLVFTIIFGKVAKIPTDTIPPFLFYMAGNVMWAYFNDSFKLTSDTFNANAKIFGKVYFPRMTVPIAVVTISMLQFLIQFVLFLGFYIYFYFKGTPLNISIYLIFLPLLLIQMALFSLGAGMVISSLTTKYKDLRFAIGFILQLWMYATPVVYPLTQVPDWLKPYYILNPMVSVVECFRYMFFAESSIKMGYIFVSCGSTVLILIAGIILFCKIEKTFMDTV